MPMSIGNAQARVEAAGRRPLAQPLEAAQVLDREALDAVLADEAVARNSGSDCARFDASLFAGEAARLLGGSASTRKRAS